MEDLSSDVSFVLADVFVYGGSTFEVQEGPICEDGSLGRFMFDGTYFCGLRLGRSNLFIPNGDVTVPGLVAFAANAGQTFGVYAILRANSSGGTADATQTLTTPRVASNSSIACSSLRSTGLTRRRRQAREQ